MKRWEEKEIYEQLPGDRWTDVELPTVRGRLRLGTRQTATARVQE